MTASIGWGEESRKTSRSEPLPADPTGQRLCEIFGHYRWNFIRADLLDEATTKAAWTTVSTYPLRPRVLWNQWQDANQLIGVRFTHDTRYALLDLDAGGDYCTADGVAQIRAALETIGITRTLLIRSSWSGGLHLYIPFAERVNTFNLAVTLKECLQSQGFRLQAGQLEISKPTAFKPSSNTWAIGYPSSRAVAPACSTMPSTPLAAAWPASSGSGMVPPVIRTWRHCGMR